MEVNLNSSPTAESTTGIQVFDSSQHQQANQLEPELSRAQLQLVPPLMGVATFFLPSAWRVATMYLPLLLGVCVSTLKIS